MIKKKNIFPSLLVMITLIATFGLAACQPQDPSVDTDGSEVNSGTGGNAGDFEWSIGSDCALCHDSEEQSFSNPACLASLHTTSDCTDCHIQIDTLEAAHAKVTAGDIGGGASRLKKTEVTNDSCISAGCHNLDELAEKTANSTVLTDENGTTVNPHDVSAVAGGTSQHEMDCSSCHEVHSDVSLQDSANLACTSCHHENVYECHTCHK